VAQILSDKNLKNQGLFVQIKFIVDVREGEVYVGDYGTVKSGGLSSLKNPLILLSKVN